MELFSKNSGYESPYKKKLFKIIVVLIVLLFGLSIIIYLLFFKVDQEAEEKHSEFILSICDAALKYIAIEEIEVNEDNQIIYVQIKDIINQNILSDEEIYDPAYKPNIFGYSKYKESLSSQAYVKLTQSSDKSFFCEKITNNRD